MQPGCMATKSKSLKKQIFQWKNHDKYMTKKGQYYTADLANYLKKILEVFLNQFFNTQKF